MVYKNKSSVIHRNLVLSSVLNISLGCTSQVPVRNTHFPEPGFGAGHYLTFEEQVEAEITRMDPLVVTDV